MDLDTMFDVPRIELTHKTNGIKRRLSTNQLSTGIDHRKISGFTVNLPENDDQLERKKRRVEQRLSSMCSPTTTVRNVTPNRRNDSLALDKIHQSFATPPTAPPAPSRTLSNEQLKEIYTNCIQLSNENKISVKNAFGLMLLDHIQDMLSSSSQKKAGDGINLNFQVAGCTLDAGVKIYSCRVDRIHSDAYRVNGCFHVGSENIQSEDESGNDEPETMDGFDKGQPRKNTNLESVKDNKKRMMQKQGCKIERNIKNINLDANLFHTDVSDPWDEVFASRPIGNFESNNVAGLFLLNLSVSEDGGFVDSTIQRPLFTPTVSYDKINKEVDLTHVEDFTKSISHLMERFSYFSTVDPAVKDESGNIQNICNVLDSFSFEKWTAPSKEDLMSGNDLEVNMLECITGCANSNLASTDVRSKHNNSLNISIDNPIANSALNAQNNQYDENCDDGIPDDESGDEPQMPDDFQTNFIQPPLYPDLKCSTSNKTLDGVSLLSTSTVPVNMTGGMSLELSIEPSEYSFFTAAMNAGSTVSSIAGGAKKIHQFMVGPEHWKLSTVRPKNIDDHRKGNDRKLTNRQKGSSDETELTESVFKTHSFLEPLSEERLESLKTISNASKHTLSKTLIGNVNSTNAYGSSGTFLDKNDGYSILDKSENFYQKFNKPTAFCTERFFKLFLMPNIRIKPSSSNATCSGEDENIVFANEDSIFCREEDGLEIKNDENLGYDLENLNDTLNYCPDISSLGDDDEEEVANRLNAECSMVPEPKHKISKLEIAYSKLAKRIDAKHLKSSIWSTLVDPDIITFPSSSSSDNNSSDKLSDEPIVKKAKIDLNPISNVKSFSDMYERLPKKLSFTSRKNLSVPIAFVCLLHLANEKSLDLTNMNDLKDILIKLPPDAVAPTGLDEL